MTSIGQTVRLDGIGAGVGLVDVAKNRAAGGSQATRKGVGPSENQIGFGRNVALFVLP